MKDLLPKIKLRAYWRVILRPTEFDKERVALTNLREIIPRCAVELRGWDFPHVDVHHPIRTGLDWVEQTTDWRHHIELWRLYQSGQFVYYGSLRDDWRDHSPWNPPPEGWKPGQSLSIHSAIFTYTEICEFAARLSLSEAGAAAMQLDITLVGLHDRSLTAGTARATLLGAHPASIPEFPIRRTYSRDDLVAAPRDIALELSGELFMRFGWEAHLGFLRDIQDELKQS